MTLSSQVKRSSRLDQRH